MKRFAPRALLATVAAGVFTAGLAAAPASAHHSFAQFDGAQFRVFTGVVVQVSPDANHLQIYFVPLLEDRTGVMRDEAGNPVVWVVEMAGAAGAAAQGITVDTFPPGTIFSVGLHPLRNGAPGGDRGQAGLFKCPENTPPKEGEHCDAVDGATQHGNGVIPEEGPLAIPETRPNAG